MITEDATVTDKGQVTIPKKIREKTGIQKGSKVYFRIRDGEVVLVPEKDEPLKELKKARESLKFSDHEIEYMIEESKQKWSNHQ